MILGRLALGPYRTASAGGVCHLLLWALCLGRMEPSLLECQAVDGPGAVLHFLPLPFPHGSLVVWPSCADANSPDFTLCRVGHRLPNGTSLPDDLDLEQLFGAPVLEATLEGAYLELGGYVLLNCLAADFRCGGAGHLLAGRGELCRDLHTFAAGGTVQWSDLDGRCFDRRRPSTMFHGAGAAALPSAVRGLFGWDGRSFRGDEPPRDGGR
ncbi:unnamed protein product, partial [Durusdinium trenchii]